MPSRRFVAARARAPLAVLVLTSVTAACAVRSDPPLGADAGPGGGAADAGPGRADSPFVPYDAGPAPDCRAVDVLFVIDDSASMADQQAALIASFEGFVAGMRARLGGSGLDFHVGVVSTDDYYANEPGCTQIGDLVTRTGGLESSNRDCQPFYTGGRYMDNHDPALEARFACVAQIGIGGSDDERVARALLNAIQPGRACNAGFLRPDALLVVVIITDEDDVADGCDGSGTCLSYGSGGTPDDWLAELSTIRDPTSVVVLSLIGRRVDNPCGAVAASRILGFTNRFDERGYVGDVCATSYDAFFTESLPVISAACEALF